MIRKVEHVLSLGVLPHKIEEHTKKVNVRMEELQNMRDGRKATNMSVSSTAGDGYIIDTITYDEKEYGERLA